MAMNVVLHSQPQVTGTIPSELQGTFMQTGPGLMEVFGRKVGAGAEAGAVRHSGACVAIYAIDDLRVYRAL